jgi:triosephosphate isomerase
MRQPLVAGNWKMNGTYQDNQALFRGLIDGMGSVKAAKVAVCPPFVYLEQARSTLAGTPIAWGAQNVSHEAPGAFTGEIASSMLVDLGCTYVIVGHSERRHGMGEGDEFVAKKVGAALNAGLTPILCVGELLEERERGETETVVERQLGAVLDRVGIEAMTGVVIAYEPVWAIGTGKTATPDQAQEVHAFIRMQLAERDREVADNLLILYGGSVKASNAAALFAQVDIDGGLIGGASLNAEEFLAICRAAG